MMGARRIAIVLAAACLALQLSACTTPQGVEPWGSSTTLSPGWTRIGNAAKKAASHPGTWAPLALAAGLQIDDADENLSDWARRETPVFGSTQNAIDASNSSLDVARNGYYLAALLAPSGDTAEAWLSNKAKGLLLGRLAVEVNSGIYGGIKRTVDRQRPDGSNYESFPSGHAGKSSAYANLGQTITPALGLDDSARMVVDTAFVLSAASAGWALVEGGRHYPADVLAGYALGNFTARFFNAAFLDSRSLLRFGATADGIRLEVRGRF